MNTVDDDEVPAEVGVRIRAHDRQDVAVLHLLRLHELDDCVVRAVGVRAGVVAIGSVIELQVRAVRIGRVEMHAVLAGSVVPAAPQQPAVGEHRRVAVVALIERDLVHSRAVAIHHVKHERGLGASLILRGELGFALIEQHCLRLPLAGR